MNFAQAIVPAPGAILQLYKTVKAGASAQRAHIPPQPTANNIPMAWTNNFMPPGRPLSPIQPMMGGTLSNPQAYRSASEPRNKSRILSADQTGIDPQTGAAIYTVRTDIAELQFTPRSYQFPPNVNTTITPRVSYGLMPFADIQTLSQDTPDVMLCPRLLKTEFSGLTPRIAHLDGDTCDDPKMQHRVDYPDGYNTISTWLSRYFYNAVIYDGPCLHLPRDPSGQISALVNVDASTIFTLIDENGNPPRPPAPAYLQIIFGTPYGFLSTEQLWYHPNHLQIGSQYGTALVESALWPATLLYNMWRYECARYTAGTMPEYVVIAPPGWTNEQIAQWLVVKSEALAGHPELRGQFDVWPAGFQQMAIKDAKFNDVLYKLAKREVMSHAGLPGTEIGESQRVLSSRGVDAMGQQVFRQAYLPWMKAAAQPFNDMFAINRTKCEYGLDAHVVEWDFPSQSIDPEKQAKRMREQFETAAITWGEYREAIGQNAFGDERDDLIFLASGGVLINPDGSIFATGAQVAETEDSATPGVDVPSDDEADAADAEGQDKEKADEADEEKGKGKDKKGKGKVKPTKGKAGKAPKPAPKKPVEKPGKEPKKKPVKKVDELFATEDTLIKHCGVCPPTGADPGDDVYYGAPIEKDVTVLAPTQGANETEIVAVHPSGRESRPFAWKAAGEENDDLVAAIGHPQYLAEEAVYLLDRALQFYLVPVTFVAEVDSERGVASHWVLRSGVILHADDYAPKWIERAAVLDFIAQQCDRTHDVHKKNVNFLTHPDDPTRPILIDNGLSFQTPESDLKLASDFVNAWGERPFTPEVTAALDALQANSSIWKRLARLVSEPAARLAQERLAQIVRDGHLPETAQTSQRTGT